MCRVSGAVKLFGETAMIVGATMTMEYFTENVMKVIEQKKARKNVIGKVLTLEEKTVGMALSIMKIMVK